MALSKIFPDQLTLVTEVTGEDFILVSDSSDTHKAKKTYMSSLKTYLQTDLHQVVFTGDYNTLINKPNIDETAMLYALIFG